MQKKYLKHKRYQIQPHATAPLPPSVFPKKNETKNIGATKNITAAALNLFFNWSWKNMCFSHLIVVRTPALMWPQVGREPD